MIKMELVEKYKKLRKKYPDSWLDKMAMMGAVLGASGEYTTDELTAMNNEVWIMLARAIIDDVKSFEEAVLLMSSITREFIERSVDAILDDEGGEK